MRLLFIIDSPLAYIASAIRPFFYDANTPKKRKEETARETNQKFNSKFPNIAAVHRKPHHIYIYILTFIVLPSFGAAKSSVGQKKKISFVSRFSYRTNSIHSLLWFSLDFFLSFFSIKMFPNRNFFPFHEIAQLYGTI